MQETIEREEVLHSNPYLYSNNDDGSIKRRYYFFPFTMCSWDDDTVFRNQGRTEKKKKRFINDTIRSDFHTAFMKAVFK
jgi:protein CWC15